MMNENGTGRWAQAIGFLGVIVSLLFVAYELKQSRDIATAELFLATAQLEMDATSSMYTAEMLRPVFEKMYSGEDLLPQERALMLEFSETWMNLASAVHFQYQLDLVTEEVWMAKRAQIRDLLALPCYSEYFQKWGDRNRASFVDDIADLLASAPKHEDCF